jgi:hypothetical protein
MLRLRDPVLKNRKKGINCASNANMTPGTPVDIITTGIIIMDLDILSNPSFFKVKSTP